MRGIRLVGAVMLALAVAACGHGSARPDAPDSAEGSQSAVTAPGLAPTDPAPPPPTHHYTAREGDVYYYSGAILQDQQNAGQAAPQAYGIKYVDCRIQGAVCLAEIYPNGMIKAAYSCAIPCQIIRVNGMQTIVYSPQSIIGAAFEDAINGRLVKTTLYPRMAAPMVNPAAPLAPQPQWQPQWQPQLQPRLQAAPQQRLPTSAEQAASEAASAAASAAAEAASAAKGQGGV